MHKPYLELKKFLLVCFVVVFSICIYSLYFQDKIPPFTYFANSNLGGWFRQSADDFISKKISSFEDSPIIFNIGGQKISANVTDLGISIDNQKTLDQIRNTEKGRGILGELTHKLGSLTRRTQLTLYYRIDFDKFASFLDTKLGNVENKPVDADIGLADGKLAIIPEKEGRVVDKNYLLASLTKNIEALDAQEIKADLINVPPRVNSAAAMRAFNRVQDLERSHTSFTYGQSSWTLADNSLLGILRFYLPGRENDSLGSLDLGSGKIVFRDFTFTDSPNPVLDITFDDKGLDSFLGSIAKTIDRPVVNASLKFVDGKVTEFSAPINGQKVDLARAKMIALSRVSIENSNVKENIDIPLSVSVTKSIENPEINSLGISELIGQGVSYFADSISNRVYNVGLGASRISGTLVAPGDTFSFNKSVGEVSGATGYRQAYIISGGRTVLDDGGGICQVSTTVFRAALAAGLPIVARTAHAYRVGYYEQGGFLPGLDATVWAPGVDLAFKNDTNHYILVQALMDSSNTRLEIDIYGTNDGRRVVLSKPLISNVASAPEAKYQDDPSLPRGVIRQVDFAAPGGNSVFTRQVYKGDTILTSDVFKSYYQPWQAVYLVGTGI